MIFRFRTIALLLVAGATRALVADGSAPSSPSRAMFLQRATTAQGAGHDSVPGPADDPMAGIRHALFKLTGPTIILPSGTPELAAFTAPVAPAPAPAATSRDIARSDAPPSPASPNPREVAPVRPVASPPAGASGSGSPATRELGLQPAGFTPYDRYLGPVRTVIANISNRGNSIAAACSFMREAHGFRYATRDPYRADPPAVTAARHEGDCKSKALWLYDQLGDPSALYVIGKVAKGAKASHAWVYWRYESRWWILDPTNRAAPIAADSVARDRYVPYYSFGKDGAFRHPATQLMLAQDIPVAHTPAVASRTAKRKARRTG